MTPGNNTDEGETGGAEDEDDEDDDNEEDEEDEEDLDADMRNLDEDGEMNALD